MSKDWKKGLNPSQKAALRTYSTDEFAEMHGQLRDPELAAVAGKRGVFQHLDSSLAKASLKEDTIVYRGVKDLGAMGINLHNAIGTTIRDPGYTSTSLSPHVAQRFDGAAIFRIKAPKGAKGASLGGIARYAHEKEVLFARHTGMRITGISKSKSGHTIIEAELVQ